MMFASLAGGGKMQFCPPVVTAVVGQPLREKFARMGIGKVK